MCVTISEEWAPRKREKKEREVTWNIFTWRNWLDNQYVPNNNNSSSSTKESRNTSGIICKCSSSSIPVSPLTFFGGVFSVVFLFLFWKQKRKERRNCNLFTRCGFLRELAFEPRTTPRSIASLRLVCVIAKRGQSTSAEWEIEREKKERKWSWNSNSGAFNYFHFVLLCKPLCVWMLWHSFLRLILLYLHFCIDFYLQEILRNKMQPENW